LIEGNQKKNNKVKYFTIKKFKTQTILWYRKMKVDNQGLNCKKKKDKKKSYWKNEDQNWIKNQIKLNIEDKIEKKINQENDKNIAIKE
jgi:hypothetical protein